MWALDLPMKVIFLFVSLSLISSCALNQKSSFGRCGISEEYKSMSIGCVYKENKSCSLSQQKIAMAHKNIVTYIQLEFGEYANAFHESNMFSSKDFDAGNACWVYVVGSSGNYLHPEHAFYFSKDKLKVEKVYKISW